MLVTRTHFLPRSKARARLHGRRVLCVCFAHAISKACECTIPTCVIGIGISSRCDVRKRCVSLRLRGAHRPWELTKHRGKSVVSNPNRNLFCARLPQQAPAPGLVQNCGRKGLTGACGRPWQAAPRRVGAKMQQMHCDTKTNLSFETLKTKLRLETKTGLWV